MKIIAEGNGYLFILSVIISLLVYLILWLEDEQKYKVIHGYYLIYAVIVGFNGVLIGFVSFAGLMYFFSDFETTVWGRLTLVLTFSLMSTQKPFHQMITLAFPTTDGKEE